MYLTISQEILRQHREDIMEEVRAARRAGAPRSDSETQPYVVRDLSWDFARYAGLSSERSHK